MNFRDVIENSQEDQLSFKKLPVINNSIKDK